MAMALMHRVLHAVRLPNWRTRAGCRDAVHDTPYGNRMPKVVHLELRKEQLKPGRLIIVGDVHGCHDELLLLLDKLKYDKTTDNLVFAGDLVNKGPASVSVLRTIRSLKAHAVRGNHDDHCLHAWHVWQHGKGELKASKDWVSAMDQEDVKLLEQLPFSIHLPDYGALVVHAGVVPVTTPVPASGETGAPSTTMQQPIQAGMSPGQGVAQLLAHQKLHDLLCMRNVVKRCSQATQAGSAGDTVQQAHVQASSHERGTGGNGDQITDSHGHWVASEAGDDGGPWAASWPGPQHVFFGHDARRKLQLLPFATGLDTGCVYGGELTAAVLPPLSHIPQHLGPCTAQGSARLAHADGATRDRLGCELVAVTALQPHVQVSKGD